MHPCRIGARRVLLALVSVAALTSSALLPGAADASGSHGSPGDPEPRIQARVPADQSARILDRPMRGSAALRTLDAEDETAAAARNGVSRAELVDVLSEDETAWLARNGRMFYADVPSDPVMMSEAESSAAPSSSNISAADALTLHSKAGSSRVIYLDFDGYTKGAGSYWVTNGEMSAGTVAPFSIDATVSTSFSADELTYIETVWRIVAEKYLPYDVDVTTEDPGTAALSRTTAGDTTYGTRVVFSDGAGARPPSCPSGSGCAGIAWVDVFDIVESAEQFEPAWVYPRLSAGEEPMAPAQVAHAAAHEVGHTLSLTHDGLTTGQAYYGGLGNWFPIMGSGVLAVGQFSKGDYPNANNSENDLTVMTTRGLALRTDDHGNTTGTATNLGEQSSYAVDGIVGSAADTDVFQISSTCVNDLTAAASGIGEGQAVDLKVSILNSGGSTLTSDDPTSGQDESFWPRVPTGMQASATVASAAVATYYVKVEGVGKGTFATGGYDDYGSIGGYHLTINGCSGSGGTAPGQPASVTATPNTHTTTGTVTWTAPTVEGGAPVTGYAITGLPTGADNVDTDPLSYPATSLVPGVTYTVGVAATNTFGTGSARTASLRVPTWAPTTAPGLSVAVSGTNANVQWSAPANPGKAVFTGWRLQVLSGATSLYDDVAPADARSVTFTGFTPGSYTIKVTPVVDADDETGLVTASKTITIVTAPSAPRIGTPSSGTAGGAVNATARWAAPLSNGGATITGYRVRAYKLTASGLVAKSYTSPLLSAAKRAYVYALPAGRYKFKVIAYNSAGSSPFSSYSAIVTAR